MRGSPWGLKPSRGSFCVDATFLGRRLHFRVDRHLLHGQTLRILYIAVHLTFILVVKLVIVVIEVIVMVVIEAMVEVVQVIVEVIVDVVIAAFVDVVVDAKVVVIFLNVSVTQAGNVL